MACDGFVRAVQRLQRITQITVVNGFFGINTDGLGDQVQGFFRLTGLKGDDAEKMIGVGMIGIDREDLAINRLGLLQLPGLVGAKTLL